MNRRRLVHLAMVSVCISSKFLYEEFLVNCENTFLDVLLASSWHMFVFIYVTERNYGVVIDAGSSSSKLHLFQWPPHDGDPTKLLTIKPLVDELGDPLMKKVEPG